MEPVQIAESRKVLHQNGNVIRAELFGIAACRHCHIHFLDISYALSAESVGHTGEYRRKHCRIVGGAVVVKLTEIIVICNRIKASFTYFYC